MSKITARQISGIEIVRERAIKALTAKGYGKFRIIWVIYQHEKRCQMCQRMIEIRDERDGQQRERASGR